MNPWNRPEAAVAGTRATEVDAGLRSYMLKIYNYMTSGVLLSGVIAYLAGTTPAVLNMLVGQNADGHVGLTTLGMIAVFAPLPMVIFLMVRLGRMSTAGIHTAFWTYAALIGLSMFTIFLTFTGVSILRVFLITAATFGLFSIYGYTTKRDLTSWGSFLFVGVWAMIGVSVLNMFLHSTGLNLALSYIGVALAIGLIAYNTQSLKTIYYSAGGNPELIDRVSIMGAFNLYASFVYLFQNLLYLMGNRR